MCVKKHAATFGCIAMGIARIIESYYLKMSIVCLDFAVAAIDALGGSSLMGFFI